MDRQVSELKFAKELDAIHTIAGDFLVTRGWEITAEQYPILAVVFTHPKTNRRVGFRFICDNWDEQPPSLVLFDPDTAAELDWSKWPQGVWSVGNSHPITGKPFLCLRGIREYHTHSSHLDDHWSNYKPHESYQLRYIVDRVRQRFGDTNG